MQLSLLAKSRRRRKIRAKLDDIARALSATAAPSEDAPQPTLSATDCAVLTEHGDVLVTSAGASTAFEAAAPKVRDIRLAAAALCAYVGCTESRVVHVRAQRGILHVYVLGKHALVVRTDVTAVGGCDLDAVVGRVDRCLGRGGEGRGLVEELGGMLQDV